jgi:glucose/arabinose dehydrogenase
MSIGDRGNMQQAQNTLNHMGSILRLNDDGTVPTDNPFVSNNLFLPQIYAYGTRNAQGLTKHPQTGDIWSHEHGPQGGDEINIVQAGANYGWPLVTFGEQYGGGTISTDTAGEGLTQPVHYWVPSIAPCGMTFISGDKYPGWEGSLLSGSLVLQHLNRTVFSNNKLIEEHRYFVGEGRIRNVVQAPDGYLYMANESDGTISKLVPIVE